MCSWRQSKPAALPLLASVELEFSFSDRPVDLIEDGFDLAIRSGNIGDGAGLMTRTIGVQRMTVCGAPTYLAKHGRPERLGDLPRHTGIVYGRTGHIRTWEFQSAIAKRSSRRHPPVACASTMRKPLQMPRRPVTALLGCPAGCSATGSARAHSFHYSGTCREAYSSHMHSGRRRRICPCASGSP